jgi:hypothetical protein
MLREPVHHGGACIAHPTSPVDAPKTGEAFSLFAGVPKARARFTIGTATTEKPLHRVRCDRQLPGDLHVGHRFDRDVAAVLGMAVGDFDEDHLVRQLQPVGPFEEREAQRSTASDDPIANDPPIGQTVPPARQDEQLVRRRNEEQPEGCAEHGHRLEASPRCLAIVTKWHVRKRTARHGLRVVGSKRAARAPLAVLKRLGALARSCSHRTA